MSNFGGRVGYKRTNCVSNFSFVWSVNAQSLCGVCVSQKQENGGKYGDGAYCILLLYNMLAGDLPTFSCCALGKVVFQRRVCVLATRHCPMEKRRLRLVNPFSVKRQCTFSRCLNTVHSLSLSTTPESLMCR